MFKRLILLTCVLAFGLAAGGCSRCGFWWDEGQQKSCKGDFPK